MASSGGHWVKAPAGRLAGTAIFVPDPGDSSYGSIYEEAANAYVAKAQAEGVSTDTLYTDGSKFMDFAVLAYKNPDAYRKKIDETLKVIINPVQADLFGG